VADDDTAEREVKAAVEAWAAAWSAKDMKAYLGAYGKDFSPPGRQSRSAWEKERESRIVGKSRISVKLSNLQVSVGHRALPAGLQRRCAERVQPQDTGSGAAAGPLDHRARVHRRLMQRFSSLV